MNASRPLFALVLLAGLALAGCSKEEAPPPKPVAPAAPEKKAPEIDPAVLKEIEADMTAARAYADQAVQLKEQGLQQERAARGSGLENFKKAAGLWTGARNKMGKWCEPNQPGVVLSNEQRDYYLAKYSAERGVWLQEAAKLGPLMQR